MSNITTYIKFRGDLSMKSYPFNEVDALILSELSYIRFENIVPTVGDNASISIADAAKKYIKVKGRDIVFYERFEELLEIMAKSPRYANLMLSNYVSQTNVDEGQQFSAIHIEINPFLTFIAFRGTDETLVGWREDCNMSYMMPVPAQISSVKYVNETAKGVFKKYMIGGHSKGGNLAIYSSVFCDQAVQNKIKAVYSFDGPGFNQTMIDEDGYQQIKNRIFAYVPESSFVGMLMEHEESYQVVKSEAVAFLQHDGFSWCVEGTHFETLETIDEFSNDLNFLLKAWLDKIDHSERKMFVDAVFDVFEAGGLEDVMAFKEINIHSATAMLKAAANLPKEQRDTVGRLIKMLIDERRKKADLYEVD